MSGKLDQITASFSGRFFFVIDHTAFPGWIVFKPEPAEIRIQFGLGFRQDRETDSLGYHEGENMVGSGFKHDFGNKTSMNKARIDCLTER